MLYTNVIASGELDGLVARGKDLVRHGIRSTTARTYTSAQRRYLQFCERYSLSPFPCHEDRVLTYIAYLDKEALRPGSVRVYLAALRSLCITEGYGNPLEDSLRLPRALRALDIKSDPPKRKLPVTYDLMVELYSVIPDTYDGHVLWAAMTLAFYGCLRASEFCVGSRTFSPQVHLRISDVSLDSVTSDTPNIVVRIKRSKTDKFNVGFSLALGCSNTKICCYCSMRDMLARRMKANITMDPASPLLAFTGGVPLTRHQFIFQTRLYLNLTGVDASLYSGHSFRSGSATTAAAVGLSDWEIQVLGRWSSTAYQRYIRAPPQLLVGFANRLARPASLTNVRPEFALNCI